MAKLGISTGSVPNDGTGDNLIDGAIKINSNFGEIYSTIGDGSTLAVPVTSIVAGSNINVSGATGNVTITGLANTANVTTDSLIVAGISTLTGTLNANGGVVGNVTGSSSQVTVSDESSDTTCFPLFTTEATGNLEPKSGTNLTFNSSSGALTATSFSGSGTDITGIVTSIVAGSNISVSGATGNVTITGLANTANVTTDSLIVTGISTLGTTVVTSLEVPLISTGVNVTGVVTATAFVGDGSQLTGVIAAGLGSRSVVSATTGSVSVGATTNLDVSGFKSYGLLKVGISSAAWVRLYVDESSRTSDAARSYLVDPTPGSGLIAEVRTVTAGISTFLMTPGIIGYNNDVSVGSTIYTSVTNNESTSATITVDLTVVKLEN